MRFHKCFTFGEMASSDREVFCGEISDWLLLGMSHLLRLEGRSRGSRQHPASSSCSTDKLRAGLFKLSCYGWRSDARRPAQRLSPLLPSPTAHTPPSEGSRSQAKLSPCSRKMLDRARRHGSECQPGTVRTAICFPLAAVPDGDVMKGEMSLIPIR